MATFIETDETPLYGQWWVNPENGKEYWLEERSFPRSNRMLCLMQECGSKYVEYFVFPY